MIVLVGVGAGVWLLLAYGHGDDQVRNQLEAIKTAGTIVVGTGGAAALLLAARRQRTAEIALKQKDRDQAHQERTHALQERVAAETMAHQQLVAADARADSIERRITELYTKAADQLGSDKAPVRLAAFTTTHFTGIAQFSGAQFTSAARFDGARFDHVAKFERTRFCRLARFDEAEFGVFGDDVRFHGAQFKAAARFGLAQFNGPAGFDDAQFEPDVPEEVMGLYFHWRTTMRSVSRRTSLCPS